MSRIEFSSENYEVKLIVDINTQLYPVHTGERYTFAIASTLHEDGSKDDGVFDQRSSGTLADKYDYVMHGHVFKCEESKDGKLYVLSSTSHHKFCVLSSSFYFGDLRCPNRFIHNIASVLFLALLMSYMPMKTHSCLFLMILTQGQSWPHSAGC